MRGRVVLASLVGSGITLGGLSGCTSVERAFGPPMDEEAGVGGRLDGGADANAPIVVTQSTESSAGGSAPRTAETASTVDLSVGITYVHDAGASSTGSTSAELDASATSNESHDTETSSSSETVPDGGVGCAPVLEVEGNCADNADDDCDGRFDCEDTDCAEALECQVACVPSAASETRCDDTKDDDCDGFLDCDDIDCKTANNCKTDCVPLPELCADTLDNDCDGFADCQDSSCASTAACCTPSGAEICNDGIDNDCDGVLDCPIIIGAVPALPATDRLLWEGGAVSADRAELTLETPVATQYTVQCRSGKPNNVQSKQFGVCDPLDPTALTVHPLGGVDPLNPIFNGSVTTQVRFAYPNGQASKPASYTYYVHSSLTNVAECEAKASDADYFAAASPLLVSGNEATFQNRDARLTAPFVNIEFTPSPSTIFEVAEGTGAVEYLSLRRRFVLNPEKTLVLMKRVYAARRTSEESCFAATIHKHAADDPQQNSIDNSRYFRTNCDAVVLNREGAGLCLIASDGVVKVANPNSDSWTYWNFNVRSWVNWGAADNFLWRKLLRKQTDGSLKMFSPKCYDGGVSCAAGNPDMLFLPDHDLFNL